MIMNKNIVDKDNILSSLASREKVVFELGCGPHKRSNEHIGIDALDFKGVDIVCDLNSGLWFLPDACADEIHSYHFLEHLEDLPMFVAEIYRVLRPGGRCVGRVPHCLNPYYCSDPTHRTMFGLYTFCYFSKSQPYRRKVPSYYNTIDFLVRHQRIVLKSEFRYRHIFKKAFERLVNFNMWTLEFYEENLSYWIPPYELYFELEKSS
jgi:SAM-dependent methyltransferase